MKDLYIVGAGGCGREVLQIIKDIHRLQGPRWNIMGFLDDTEAPLAGKACDYGVVGTIVDYMPKENDVLVMAIADPQAKRKLSKMLLERGAVFETVIHPEAHIGEFNSIGMGAVIYRGFSMSVNIHIGDFATLLDCLIGHDVSIGDYFTVCGLTGIAGNVRIGDGVYIGTHCAIAPHAVIEDDAYVGIGSIVLRRVKAGKKVFGNPARTLDF